MSAPLHPTLSVAFVVLALPFAAASHAADDVALESIACFGGTTQRDPATGADSTGTYDVTGGVVPAAGPLPALSLECSGRWEVRARVAQHRGECTLRDAAGNQIHQTEQATPQAYTWTFIGGTGKFAGIHGSGTLERLLQQAPVRPGTMQGCRRIVGRVALPALQLSALPPLP